MIDRPSATVLEFEELAPVYVIPLSLSLCVQVSRAYTPFRNCYSGATVWRCTAVSTSITTRSMTSPSNICDVVRLLLSSCRTDVYYVSMPLMLWSCCCNYVELDFHYLLYRLLTDAFLWTRRAVFWTSTLWPARWRTDGFAQPTWKMPIVLHTSRTARRHKIMKKARSSHPETRKWYRTWTNFVQTPPTIFVEDRRSNVHDLCLCIFNDFILINCNRKVSV